MGTETATFDVASPRDEQIDAQIDSLQMTVKRRKALEFERIRLQATSDLLKAQRLDAWMGGDSVHGAEELQNRRLLELQEWKRQEGEVRYLEEEVARMKRENEHQEELLMRRLTGGIVGANNKSGPGQSKFKAEPSSGDALLDKPEKKLPPTAPEDLQITKVSEDHKNDAAEIVTLVFPSTSDSAAKPYTAFAPLSSGTLFPVFVETTEHRQVEPGKCRDWIFQSITGMPVYSGMSFEELRLQDYFYGRKTSMMKNNNTTANMGVSTAKAESKEPAVFGSSSPKQSISFMSEPMSTGTKSPPFVVTVDENVSEVYCSSNGALHYHSISAMPVYWGMSFEELRHQDYLQERRGATHVVKTETLPVAIDRLSLSEAPPSIIDATPSSASIIPEPIQTIQT